MSAPAARLQPAGDDPPACARLCPPLECHQAVCRQQNSERRPPRGQSAGGVRRHEEEVLSSTMSSPNDPREPEILDPIDDLMIPEHGDEQAHGERVSSSVRDIASRIPESLASIGRDISRTVERALSAKDDYVVAVKVSHEAQERLEQLVQAGVFRSRADAAAFLIDEGIKAQTALFERVSLKLSEIERLRAELRGMITKEG